MSKPRLLSQINSLTVAEAAYIAGFLEADGHITCQCRGEVPHPNRVRVVIGQKDPKILYWVQKITGGGAIYQNQRSQSFSWHLAPQNSIRNFLEQILPYMKIKRARARAVLAGTCPKVA